MRKTRFTESQIVRILKEVEAGRAVQEVCREYGVSRAAYYKWKSNYGSMEPPISGGSKSLRTRTGV